MEQPEETLSTYFSIIPEEGDQWVQLRISDPLVELHGKFWGVNMQDEETKWRSTQPPEEEPMNVDVDNRTPEEHEKEEDDIGPGSYILTLDIPSIEVSQLWIRQEYIRVYDFCEKYLDICIPEIKTPSVILTGQPGIGKSYWIMYAMRRYLAEKKPVICDFRHTTLKTRVRTLVDNDHDGTPGVPAHLAASGNKYFIIFTASPNPALWKNMTRTKHFAVCTMNPWTKKEISKSAVIHRLAEDDKKMYEMYDEFGPTSRICFDYVNNPDALVLHVNNCNEALGSLSSATLRRMVDDTTQFSMDSLSHTLVLVERMSKELKIPNRTDDYATKALAIKPRVKLVSPVTENKIRVRLWEQSRAEKLQLYRQLSNVESTRCIAGLGFEAWAHSKLEKGINISLVPMVKKESPESGQEKNMPRWHSNHGCGQPYDITPLKTEVYEESSLDKIEDMVYYVPESKTQVALDSFIKAKEDLYIFQCSIASVHHIKAGILPFFSHRSLPSTTTWHFIFVIPNDGSGIKCPQPHDSGLKKLLDTGKMKLFTMTLDVSGTTLALAIAGTAT